MKTASTFLFLSALIPLIALGQATSTNLYMPLEFKNAFSNGIRKTDGTVSDKYWQNKSQYKIKATIDPFKKQLIGEADISYFNQSPDTLKQIVFHAYADYYKLGSIRNKTVSPEKDRSIITKGMELKALSIGSEQIDLKGKFLKKEPTLYVIRLTKPLSPRGSLNLHIEWEVEIPGKGFDRAGASDSTSMFVAYWYPEIAVYDDIDGWDKTIYNGGTEFYHDFSDFEIQLTTPETFIVWASVQATNEKEIFPEKIIARLAQARISENPIKVITTDDIGKIKLKSTIWKYKASNLPDFAFALSDHYVWDACRYKDNLGEYLLNSAYDPSHKSFSAVIENEKASLNIFHNKFPRYKFPFGYFTVFNGDSGMEFPGMAHDREIKPKEFEQRDNVKVDDFEANIRLTSHEMLHSYFPFLMGINEKKYAWMDEGLASFSLQFIKYTSPPQLDFDLLFLSDQFLAPMMVPSSAGELGANSYLGAGISYEALYSLLGKDTFLTCMEGYMDRWKYKHPTPYDFMNTFNSISRQDLNWFWKAWYFDWGYIDLGIADFSKGFVTVKNEGGKPMAFNLVITGLDGRESVEKIKPDVWRVANEYKLKVANYDKVKKIEIKSPLTIWIDALRSNDKWEVK